MSQQSQRSHRNHGLPRVPSPPRRQHSNMGPQPVLMQQVVDLTENMNLVLQYIEDQRNHGSTPPVEEQQ